MGKWEMVQLGDVCSPKQWKTISTDQLLENGYPVYGANGKIGFYSKYTHEKETVLITCRGATCGAVNICEKYSYVNGNAMALDDLSPNVSWEYLAHYFRKRGFSDIITGSAQPQIIRSNIERIFIPLPPLDVQEKIADVLDKAAALIELRRTQLDKLDLLIKSQFIEMFGDPVTNPMGWENAKLGSILSVEPQNGFYRPQSDYRTDGSGVPILRIDAFYNGKVTDWSALKRLICTDEEKKRYLLRDGDIVVNRVNSIEYLGKCAIITGMLEDTVFESNMMRFHPDEKKILPLYLSYFLCLPYTYNQIIAHAKKSVNQASINQSDVQDFEILLPPIDLQNQFSTFVQQVEKSKFTLQQSLSKLELNYKSLMQKCFRGEIF